MRDAVELEAYLRAESRLPGPRANLGLLGTAADEVDRGTALSWGAREVGRDPTDVFVVMVGLAALGKLLGGGDRVARTLLRHRANDGEWRIREAVAIALQRLGDANSGALAAEVFDWSLGNALEARAAVAAVAEPRLLRDPALVRVALDVLDRSTTIVARSASPLSDDVKVLRQALGYAWSIVVAADPDRAARRFAAWFDHPSRDVQWLIGENRKKKRLSNVIFPAR
jgi:hypothetical protein